MKNLATTTLIVLLSLYAFIGSAQNIQANKPSLFSNYPDIINCTSTQLNSFFDGRQGQNVKVAFADNFKLSGLVKSNLVKYSNLQTVTIALPAFNNILFSLSKRTDNREIITYVGHLFSSEFADGYELKKIDNENYRLIKINMAKILPDCNQ